MAGRYPPIEPHASGFLDVGAGHRIHWEAVGSPDGVPAVFLHGGPGSGCTAEQRQLFDPARYRAVLFDQRNCGRSLPHAADQDTDLSTNTTSALISDIEALRRHLGIERWVVVGGSWGSTLAFAYAEQHPEQVSAMVHFAVTTTSRTEIDRLYGDVGRLAPEAWARFRAAAGGPAGNRLPDAATGSDLVRAYEVLLNDPAPAVRMRAALDRCAWEDAVAELETGHPDGRFAGRPQAALGFARICVHYFGHDGFLDAGRIVGDAGRLRDIPTVLVHGAGDVGSPPVTARAMARVLPHAELHVLDGVGHGTGPGFIDTVIDALDRIARLDRVSPSGTG